MGLGLGYGDCRLPHICARPVCVIPWEALWQGGLAVFMVVCVAVNMAVCLAVCMPVDMAVGPARGWKRRLISPSEFEKRELNKGDTMEIVKIVAGG